MESSVNNCLAILFSFDDTNKVGTFRRNKIFVTKQNYVTPQKFLNML